jgi:hypothetical protein
VLLALVATLPASFHPTVRLGILIAIAFASSVALLLARPSVRRHVDWPGPLTLCLFGVASIGTLVLLALLVGLLVTASDPDGPRLLLAALQIWVANVIAFAVLFWALDSGGPETRRSDHAPALDASEFRFPQSAEATITGARSWSPAFLDYLVASLSTAMSLTRAATVPLSSRAKILMSLEAFSGFVLLGVVVARAVELIA